MAKIRRKAPLSEHQQHVLNTIAYMTKANIVVYNARIAVIRDPEDTVSPGGIIIPDAAQRKIPRGTVVGVGLGVSMADDAPGTKIGDQVMYTKYNPTLFTIKLPNGETSDLEIMHVSDLYIGWRTP